MPACASHELYSSVAGAVRAKHRFVFHNNKIQEEDEAWSISRALTLARSFSNGKYISELCNYPNITECLQLTRGCTINIYSLFRLLQHRIPKSDIEIQALTWPKKSDKSEPETESDYETSVKSDQDQSSIPVPLSITVQPVWGCYLRKLFISDVHFVDLMSLVSRCVSLEILRAFIDNYSIEKSCLEV